jgi:hypothetical protein
MSADEPGPLPRGLLDRLPGSPAADLAVLRDGGYLKLALPARLGGAGLDLTGLACAQRQLAARAPATARTLNAHHAWVGAAADVLASGAGEPEWILADAARGRRFTGFGPEPRHGDALAAGWYAWSLALDGMTSYAIARRAFDQALEQGRPGLDGWPLAEAALRLDDMRGRLDEVIAGWQQRVAAGGDLLRLDPGRLSLIRQFTARHVAADGLHRVAELIAAVPAGHAEAA